MIAILTSPALYLTLAGLAFVWFVHEVAKVERAERLDEDTAAERLYGDPSRCVDDVATIRPPLSVVRGRRA